MTIEERIRQAFDTFEDIYFSTDTVPPTMREQLIADDAFKAGCEWMLSEVQPLIEALEKYAASIDGKHYAEFTDGITTDTDEVAPNLWAKLALARFRGEQ